MTRAKSGLDQLGFLIILIGTIGAAAVAQAQAQLEPPTALPAGATIHDVKVRPRDEQTDGRFAPTAYASKSSSTSEPKPVRTTRERITDGSAPPAVAPLQPSPAKP